MASYIAYGIHLVTCQRYCPSFLRKNGQYQSVKARLQGFFTNQIVQFFVLADLTSQSVHSTW